MRPEEGLPPASTQFQERNYSADLRLAYLGPPTLGVGINEFGAGAGGSVTAYFSDILGQQNIGFTFQGGGGSGTSSLAEQLGGELLYLNQTRRLNWGADLQHIPIVYGSAGYLGFDDVTQSDVYAEDREVQLITDLSGLAQYPLSTTRRIEGAIGAERFSFKVERTFYFVQGGRVVNRERQQLVDPIEWTFTKASAAFVGDSSLYGFLSPIKGTRYRYEIEALRGDLNFQTALADWRKYFFFRPVTVAVRRSALWPLRQHGRVESALALYLGRGSLMRGYDPYSNRRRGVSGQHARVPGVRSSRRVEDRPRQYRGPRAAPRHASSV
jgi:hypothetical protein